MKKITLRREVIRQLTPVETRKAAGDLYVVHFSAASCECTQICTFTL
jgi:hypothetical protein